MKAAGITDAHRVGNVGLYPLGSTSHPTASRVGAPGQQWSVSFGSLALVVSGRQGVRRFRVGRQVRIGRRVFDTVWSVRCRRSGRAVGAISPALASLSGRVITCTIPVTGTSRRGAAANTSDRAVSPIATAVAIEQALSLSPIRDLDAPTSAPLGEGARRRIRCNGGLIGSRMSLIARAIAVSRSFRCPRAGRASGPRTDP